MADDTVADARLRLAYALSEYIDELAEAPPIKAAIDALIAAVRAENAQRCRDYRPDHNGECLNCDDWYDAHLCKVVGEPEAGRKVCELLYGHDGYHQQGNVRWLGYHPPS